jgi:hypothetical protein
MHPATHAEQRRFRFSINCNTRTQHAKSERKLQQLRIEINSIRSLKSMSYCRFKYINVYIF